VFSVIERGWDAAAWLSSAEARPVPPLKLAWQHSGQFWAKTGTTFAHHWVPLLLCALVPAIARGYILLQRGSLRRGRVALFDLLVTISRVFLCAVAVWAACTGNEWRQLSSRWGAVAAWQVGLGLAGVNVAHRLRMLLWELLFFAVVFLLARQILRWAVQAGSLPIPWLHESHRRRAALSVTTNLLLVPVAVVYLVEIVRPLFH
jgi:hypothetical protein